MRTIIIISVCGLFFLNSNLSLAQSNQAVTIPDTAAGRQLKEWLRVFTGGDDKEFKKFITENYSKELLAETREPISTLAGSNFVTSKSLQMKS
jgi:hypothetical protein